MLPGKKGLGRPVPLNRLPHYRRRFCTVWAQIDFTSRSSRLEGPDTIADYTDFDFNSRTNLAYSSVAFCNSSASWFGSFAGAFFNASSVLCTLFSAALTSSIVDMATPKPVAPSMLWLRRTNVCQEPIVRARPSAPSVVLCIGESTADFAHSAHRSGIHYANHLRRHHLRVDLGSLTAMR